MTSDEPVNENEEGKYHDSVDVHGIQISVGWDSGYNGYIISFPQIQLNEEARNNGVDDQVIRLTRNPKVAEEVFRVAVIEADFSRDLFATFRKVKDYSMKIPKEDY